MKNLQLSDSQNRANAPIFGGRLFMPLLLAAGGIVGCNESVQAPDLLSCSLDADCANRTDGKTKCDTASHQCVDPQLPQPECSGDTDCANRTDGKTKCDIASQRCIEPQLPQPECSGDSDCANRTDGKNKCDTASQQCIDPQLPQPECGNNQIETGESCDSADLNLKSCLDLGFKGGTLACSNDCNFDTSGCFECVGDEHCTQDAAKPYCRNHVCVPKCGNNQLDDDEACDGTLFRGGVLSCSEYSGSFNTGMLSCTSECEIDDSACGNIQLSECGNNYLNDNEDCDGSLFKNNATSCSSWNEYYNTGNVSCHDCTIDYSNCKYCLPFVDDEIKKYALSNWDTNRDGCIAREEAASVTEIPFQAFENNEQLKTLDDLKQFPNLKRIGDFAFDGCKSLTSVDLPQVTAIYSYVFNKCTSLTSVNLPQVTAIYSDVFNKCTSLTSVNLPQVTIIGDRAFYDCSSLTSINSPQVTMIGEAAFYSCTSVKSIDFPNVATVGERAFSKCTSLTSVDWPNLTELASSTFSVCTSLKTVKLPKLNKIGTDVFYNCPKLTSLSLTSPDKIKSNVNKPFSEFSSNQCSLTLNENKKRGGSSEPQVEADGKTWFGALWKEIKYTE